MPKVIRKNYFIVKDLQSRFILRFVVIATVWAAITVFLFAYMAGKQLDELCYSSHIDIETTSELLMPVTVRTQVVSILLFGIMLAYTVHSLWQRLSPPLYDLKKDIAMIAHGELKSGVSLRKNDEFQSLAADIDDMRIRLREKFVRIKEQQLVLYTAASELKSSIAEGNPSLHSVTTLQSAVEQMKADISAFHD